ncbi:hypothetical protein [Sphaerisporangium perillae]|nr:hypothetical protein [Sphaerisporangium perillae]
MAMAPKPKRPAKKPTPKPAPATAKRGGKAAPFPPKKTGKG